MGQALQSLLVINSHELLSCKQMLCVSAVVPSRTVTITNNGKFLRDLGGSAVNSTKTHKTGLEWLMQRDRKWTERRKRLTTEIL